MQFLHSNDLLSAGLHHRYSCAQADGHSLVLPASGGSSRERSQPVGWSDIAIGMMVGLNARRAGTLEAQLLQSSSETWASEVGASLGLLILADCHAGGDGGEERAPHWLQRPAADASLEWRCYRGPAKPGSTLWRKTWALLRALDQSAVLGRRSFYLKMDVDALLLPRSLLQFIRYLGEASPAGSPLYFGNQKAVNRNLYCWRPRCLFQSEAWQGVLLRANWSRADAAALRGQELSYAAGGLYGFDVSALRLIARSDCLAEAAGAVATFGARHVAEDELVGLCMLRHRVRLVSCECFYQYGPCDCHNFSSCADDLPGSRLCRLPLSIHKLKRPTWFLPWWRYLREREASHLREV